MRDFFQRYVQKSRDRNFVKLRCLISYNIRVGFLSGYPIKRKKNSDPGDEKSSGYPKGKKSRIARMKIPGIPGVKISRLEKIPNRGDRPKISGIFGKSQKNPRDLQPEIKNSGSESPGSGSGIGDPEKINNLTLLLFLLFHNKFKKENKFNNQVRKFLSDNGMLNSTKLIHN